MSRLRRWGIIPAAALTLAVLAGLPAALAQTGPDFVVTDSCLGTSHDTPRIVVVDELTGQVTAPPSVQSIG
ncbi:MAG: hypothetical protein R3290_09380, partial [Acidimicrobiia bacterium]|nr:hypothetical protein [Acidimicrobiia bacterium]